ncbi:ATP-dependent RNA helicase-like protein dbp8 [Cenococcum geophilum 1.58]|uniref:ATP-dependent RNA helicase-like protein dbp8 n=1 Tax=Cenococcum geophilum 1.58 TaxID=794803 RepID=UPI00358EA416|nr:ATP-dependent RNA helicase-like protein dbp8 [Cenococcum geophilum 1.58]
MVSIKGRRVMSSSQISDQESHSSQESSKSVSVSHIPVDQDVSRKRRKLSPAASEEPFDSLPYFPISSLSRIKAKKIGLLSQDSGKLDPVASVLVGQEKTSFASLGVAPWLVASLAAMEIKRPTGIQKGCIPEILMGRDCIGGSRTGSGKTVAFAVPVLQRWAEDPVGIFAVVLTPTRELALQIFEQFKAISAPQSLKPILVTGGSDMRTQALALAQRPHVVIATPGRLADHINTSGEDTICGLRRTRFVVLDEADRLLAAGHGSMLPDVETCLSVLPPSTERQTCLFTATVTPEVRALKELPRSVGRPPVFVCEVDTEVLAIPPTLQQKYLQAPVTHRECYLHILLNTPANLSKSVIIFCNRTSTATLLEHMLRLLEHRVTSLHSGLPQPQRISNLARFRAKAARILVATDVAARGLDIPEVALVINYDVPRDPDDYIHRVGRTARAGRAGESVTIVGQRDVELILAIEERVGKKTVEYEEEGVSIEGRVVRDGLKIVGEKKREAMLQIEEGRDVVGKRKKGMPKRVKK